jgi:PAS domain S-box-containing protein
MAHRRENERAAKPPETTAAGSPRAPPDAEIYKTLVESVRDYAIFALDPTGHIATWNPGAERLKGYRENEIVGKHFSIFYPEEDVARGKPAQELIIAEEYGRYEEEGWRIRKDGSRFWASVTITAMRDPHDRRLVGFSKVTRDLTERRQTLETLRQSEERFRLLVEGVRDYAIFMIDVNGRVQSWNQGAQRLKGYRPTEIVGESFEKFYPPEDLAAGKPQRELEIARSEGVYEEEGWRIRKDGTRFWASVIITALRDPRDDRLLGYAKVTRDLTERRRSEESLLQAYADLEAFSYTVSHDLRAPLRAMEQLAEITVHDGGATLDEGSKRNLEAIRASAARASRLVEDLLRFARAGNEDLNRDDVDLAALARSIVGSLQERSPERQVKLLAPEEPVIVDADPALLRVALDNLLANAWKFTRPVASPTIEVGTMRSDRGEPTFFVRDNGVGFDPEKARLLFQPFQRLHREAEFDGTGIGLATVRRIIERHGGRVWAEGKPGAGATIYFTLPAEASRRSKHS